MVQIKEDCQIPSKEFAEKELLYHNSEMFDGVMGWRKISQEWMEDRKEMEK